ncbi:TetR/AcrR family transcriptional regulator [Azorhizobium sp. AG788]|uniref:TetR/AcrR family transcriptional regulator n=1 Tax=Azorhizobium sp. AG788 TaxID=2183897 RepID=UPI003139ECFF
MVSTAPPRRARDKAVRRADILAAALEVFAAHGYAAARLDDVARAAGVAKGTLYLYFADKQALFEGLIKENLVPIPAAASDMLLAFEGTTADLLPLLSDLLIDRILSPPANQILRLMLGEGHRFPELGAFYYREVVTPGLAVMRAIAERGVARGEIRGDALLRHPQMFIAPFLTTLVWNTLFNATHPLDARAFASDYITSLLQGLAIGERP